MNYGVGHRHGKDLALLWLWLWPANAAPIQPLPWELPCAEGSAQKRQKKKKERKEGRKREKERKLVTRTQKGKEFYEVSTLERPLVKGLGQVEVTSQR